MRTVKRPVATTVTPSGVTYHDTEVIHFNADGSDTLNSGGYQTNTTKQRINQYNRHGAIVFQKKHVWYVQTVGGVEEFHDGMVIGTIEQRVMQAMKGEL